MVNVSVIADAVNKIKQGEELCDDAEDNEREEEFHYLEQTSRARTMIPTDDKARTPRDRKVTRMRA